MLDVTCYRLWLLRNNTQFWMPSQSIMLITSKPEKILLVCWSEEAYMKSIYSWKEARLGHLVGSKNSSAHFFYLKCGVFACVYVWICVRKHLLITLPLYIYVRIHVFIFVQLFWEIELLCYYHNMLSWIYIILYPWQHFTVEWVLLKNSDFEKCDQERKTALVGKIMSCVIRAYSLIHYSFTTQLTVDKSVILILYNGCDLANKYFMWKIRVIPSCKKII